jgi:hypothetical protein
MLAISRCRPLSIPAKPRRLVPEVLFREFEVPREFELVLLVVAIKFSIKLIKKYEVSPLLSYLSEDGAYRLLLQKAFLKKGLHNTYSAPSSTTETS